jgi:hypothetical protein
VAAITRRDIPYDVEQEMNSILGQPCCRQSVGNDLSLFLGFGGIVSVKNPRGETLHGKWEIGSYRSAWRIIHNHSIICGSRELIDSVDELRQQLVKLDGVNCIKIGMLTEFDVRVVFDRELCVDFLGAFGDDDEVFHAFLPQDRVVSLSLQGGWVSQVASQPS